MEREWGKWQEPASEDREEEDCPDTPEQAWNPWRAEADAESAESQTIFTKWSLCPSDIKHALPSLLQRG